MTESLRRAEFSLVVELWFAEQPVVNGGPTPTTLTQVTTLIHTLIVAFNSTNFI